MSLIDERYLIGYGCSLSKHYFSNAQCQAAFMFIRTTKIYSLLYLVREILTKGHPKVKWGQIFNNIRLA